MPWVANPRRLNCKPMATELAVEELAGTPSASIKALSALMHPAPPACKQPAQIRIRVNPFHPRRCRAATSEKIRALKLLPHLQNYASVNPVLPFTPYSRKPGSTLNPFSRKPRAPVNSVLPSSPCSINVLLEQYL